MATASQIPLTSGVVFRDVTWDDYEAQLRIVGERPIRVTYDQGTMEVFMPSFGHEDDAYRLGWMVDTLTEELDIAVKAGRTTTHKRQDLDRGAEPDQCYWLGDDARRMAGKRQLDLIIDPPPALAIEVDISHSSLDRLPIFAAIGIPEIWHLTLASLQFLHLQPEGTYQPHDRSRAFPGLPAAEVARFLEQGRTGEDTAWVRSFRAYVREFLTGHTEQRPEGNR
jgi:Uma2 family endonuclease